MSHPIGYQRAYPPSHPQWWPGVLAGSLALVVGACVMWDRSSPAFGERPLSATKIWMARCAAASLWMAAHALIVGIVFPAIYRPRPLYSGLTALCGLIALLGGVSAMALWLAS